MPGVRWSGLWLMSQAAPSGPPMLEATTDNAYVVLTFPPQHIAEEVEEAGGHIRGLFDLWEARLAGPSRLAFDVHRGDVIPLDIAGLRSKRYFQELEARWAIVPACT